MTEKYSIAKKAVEVLQNVFIRGRASRGPVNNRLDAVNPMSPDFSSRRHATVRPFSRTAPEYTREEYVRALTYSMDLAENNASVHGVLRNLAAHAVGGGPYPAVMLDPDKDTDGKLSESITDALEDWFNDCDYRGRDWMTMSAMCRRVVKALRDSGSILFVFDNFMHSSGRILVVEASNFASLSDSDFKTWWSKKGPGLGGIEFDGQKLVNGVVYNKFDLVIGYVFDVSSSYQFSNIVDNCQWAPKSSCVMFANPNKATDDVPMPELLIPYNISQDAETLRNNEVLAAIKAARMNYAVIGGSPAYTPMPDGRSSSAEPITDEEAIELSKRLAAGEEVPSDYAQSVEDETGSGAVALPQGADIKALESGKPKASTEEHFLRIREEQGASIGAASSFARMKSDTSYTAAMNDRNMTSAHIDMDRADIENGLRKLCVLRLEWEDANNDDFDLKAIAAADRRWARKIIFQWPKFRAINPQQEATAQEKRLQSGEENLLDVFGPAWKQRLKQRRREYEMTKEGGGIPTTAFESTPGAIGPTTPEVQQ